MRKFLLPIFLIIFLPLAGRCQIVSQKTVDSLFTKLQTAAPDTNQLNILHQLGNYYLKRHFGKNNVDLDSAQSFFNKEIDLSTKLHVDKGSGRLESLCSIGEVYFAKNQFEQGKSYFMQVRDYYHKAGDKKMEGKILLRFGTGAAEIAWTHQDSNFLNQVFDAYEKAIDLFVAGGDAWDEILVYYYMAYAHFLRDRMDLAEADCTKAINKYHGSNYSNLASIYYVMAHIQRYRGNLDKALFYSLESIKQLEKSNDKNYKTAKQSSLFGELAEIYEALGQTENSIVWYKKTLALRENMPLKLEYKYRTAGFIIKGLIKQKKTAEALDIALGIEKRHPPDNDYDRAIISQVKATCYDALGKDKKAEELYILALKLFGDVTTDEIVSLTKYDIAKFYIKKGEFKKAGFYLNEGITNVISIERKRDYHLIYYKIDSANGNYISALQHHIQFKMLNDSIFNIEKNRQFQELQVRYETEQKERDISSLKKESVLQHEKAARANNSRNFTLLGSAMLIVLLGVIYSNNRAKQRSNVALSLLVNEKDKLLEEKEWLMKEIHHRVKNNLQIVMGLLQRQSAFIDNKEALTAIRNSEHRMHSIALIHQKLYQSESLALVNMGDYIDEMIGYLHDSFDLGTRIRFEKQVDQIDLEINIAVPLGLVLNEAITNAIKYAFPMHEKGCIRVLFNKITDSGYLLQIADDGRGLPVDFDIKKINSMGFNLMRGLSKQVGGVFEVAHNNGVTITIKMAHV